MAGVELRHEPSSIIREASHVSLSHVAFACDKLNLPSTIQFAANFILV